MQQENIVLCAISSYEKKYYLNDSFIRLPQKIKDELKMMCVLYIEDVGGVLTLEYNEEGTLYFHVSHDDGDLFFDEIGSALKIKQMQVDKKEFLNSLEMYYKVFFMSGAKR